ncbi:MAG: type II secretion system protein GspF, partial [Nitrospinae bacterium]|nr:type II secretion system protein GspF [Nitrospinota bacterium]
MPVFAYQATDRHGKLITGKIDAEEKQQVVTVLQKQNVLPIQIKQEKGFYPNSSSLSFSNPFKEASNNDIMIFTRQLSTLLISGITLDKSLFILTDLTEKEKLRDIIKTVREKVHGGSTFADALTKYPKIFTRLFINMVRVGETGGVLGEVTERLSDFLEKTQKLKENIQSAMIYPALLALIGGSAVVVLMIFVIPKFAIIFSDIGQTIPPAAAILIGLSSFVSNYWWIVLFFIILSCYMGWHYIRTPQGKYKWDTWVLEIPYIGSLVRKIEISRFCRTFGTLIKSGVPVLQSLLIV